MDTTIYRTIKGSEIEKMFDSSFDEFSIRYYNATDLYDSDIYDNNNKYKFEIKIRHDEGTIANMIFDKEYSKMFLPYFKTINVFDLNKREYVEININDITEFGIQNWKSYRKDGKFKKFNKNGYIRTKGNECIEILLHGNFNNSVNVLKRILKGKFSTRKDTDLDFKYDARGSYVGERKATNWYYTILN